MGIKILVVDDSSIVRKEFRKVLDAYVVFEAQDGVEGLAVLKENPDIRLVLLDVNMPRMGGLDMLDELRLRRCPAAVLMLTTEGHPDQIRRARDAGAKGWLVKPVDHGHLTRLVSEFATRNARRVG